MKYDFKKYQLEFIKGLTNIDASGEINDEQEKKIKKCVEKELLGSFTKDDMPTDMTFLCESIFDLISDTKRALKKETK